VETGTFTETGRAVVQSANGGRGRFRGAEFAMRWQRREATRFDLLLGYVHGEDVFAGETTPADRIPPLHGRLSVEHRVHDRLRGSLVLSGAARQDRLSRRDVRDPRIDPSGTDSWLRLDARVSWQLRDSLSLRVDLGNLTDAAYREHGSGIDAPGRHVTLAVDWRS